MNQIAYPKQLELQPIVGVAPEYEFTLPGSKSITNRALVLASMAAQQTDCLLTGALQSEDTEVMLECLKMLGFVVDADWQACTIRVSKNNSGRIVPAMTANLFCANSGTTIRFLTAMLALADGSYRLDGIPRMRERPIHDLLEALNHLPGVNASSENGTGCPPVKLDSTGLRGGRVTVRADVSSQFLSGLLLAGAFTPEVFEIDVAGETVSEPYIDMTLNMLKTWGAKWERPTPNQYRLLASKPGIATYAIEPDASSASYFFAMAAVMGCTVSVRNMNRDMLQGDVAFVDALARMGATVLQGEDSLQVRGGPLRGIDIDMNAISDTVMTLAAVACFAVGPTRIRNVAHIRHKETDRLAAVATELKKLGVRVEEYNDGLMIDPGPMTGSVVDTYNDHRIAMSMAIIGLKVPGLIIDNPACVMKTFPDFWQRWPGSC